MTLCVSNNYDESKYTLLTLNFPNLDTIHDGKYSIHEVFLTNELLKEFNGFTYSDITNKKIKAITMKNKEDDSLLDLNLYIGYSNTIFNIFFIDNPGDLDIINNERIIDDDKTIFILKSYEDSSLIERNILCDNNYNPNPNSNNIDPEPINDFIFDLVLYNLNHYNINILNNEFTDEHEYNLNNLRIELVYILKDSLTNIEGFLDEIDIAVDLYIKNYISIVSKYQDNLLTEQSKLLNNYDFCESNNDDYEKIINNPYIFLKNLLKEYKTYLDEDYIKGILPDIYMLCGAVAFPTTYEKRLNDIIKSEYKPACKLLINFSEQFFYIFKQSSFWFYINLIVCFCAQILAPIYYIYDYKKNHDLFCPNNSDNALKILGVIFFLTLYSQYNDMQDKIISSQFKYSQTYFIKYTFWLALSYIINQGVTFLIPIVTFILFLEDPTILGFILNCLTALFLVELDNITAVASTTQSLMDPFVNDYMLLELTKKGVRKNHFIRKIYSHPIISSLVIISSMLQVGLMFFLSITIGFCL